MISTTSFTCTSLPVNCKSTILLFFVLKIVLFNFLSINWWTIWLYCAEMYKPLTEAEIENELNEFYANSESEDELDVGETDEALEDFEIEPEEQGMIGN